MLLLLLITNIYSNTDVIIKYLKYDSKPGQHEPVDILQPDVLTEAGERPAHGEQG